MANVARLRVALFEIGYVHRTNQAFATKIISSVSDAKNQETHSLRVFRFFSVKSNPSFKKVYNGILEFLCHFMFIVLVCKANSKVHLEVKIF